MDNLIELDIFEEGEEWIFTLYIWGSMFPLGRFLPNCRSQCEGMPWKVWKVWKVKCQKVFCFRYHILFQARKTFWKLPFQSFQPFQIKYHVPIKYNREIDRGVIVRMLCVVLLLFDSNNWIEFNILEEGEEWIFILYTWIDLSPFFEEE